MKEKGKKVLNTKGEKIFLFGALRAFLTVLEKTFNHRSLVGIPRMESGGGVISPNG